jgi:hypothetical protein
MPSARANAGGIISHVELKSMYVIEFMALCATDLELVVRRIGRTAIGKRRPGAPAHSNGAKNLVFT